MRHYVLTRSSYGPAWDIAANRRRLAVTRAVTARLMGLQGVDWTWIVLLDERDPLLRERMALYASSAPAFTPIVWTPNDRMTRHSAIRSRQRIAAADYAAPWRRDIPSDEMVLMTRLDDDDGFAPDALARFQAKATSKRQALMLPVGLHAWRGQFTRVRHERNAMHTLVTPPGDTLCVYDYGHTKVADPVMVDEEPGWIWVRHHDTISNARNPRSWATPGSDDRWRFPVDWTALREVWR